MIDKYIPPYAVGRRLEVEDWRRYLWVSTDISLLYHVRTPEALMRSDTFEHFIPQNIPEYKRLTHNQVERWVLRTTRFNDVRIIYLYIEGNRMENMYEVFVK